MAELDRHGDLVEASRLQRALALKAQPTELRRCLGGCDDWMHSTGPDHRICNPCQGIRDSAGSLVGRRVTRTDRKKGVSS